MTSCEYAHDDGAYVLGALAPAERTAYERHLAGCPACRQAVAELAVLPGLLGRLDPAEVAQLVEPPAEPSRVPALLAAARARRQRERRGARRRYAATALAAAVLAVVVGGGAAWLLPQRDEPAPPARTVVMRPVRGETPVHAEIALRRTAWGTEVTMRCGYDAIAGEYAKAYPFRLVAYGPDGASEQVGSWLAAPGDDVRLSGATRFTDAELVRLELVAADGTPVLAYAVP